MHFTMFSFAIILIFATVSVREIHRGYREGLRKSLVSLGALLLSLLTSLALSPVIASWFTSFVFGIVTDMSFYRDLVRSFGDIRGFVELCVGVVVSVFIFVWLVFLFRAIIRLLARAVTSVALRGRYNSEAVDPCGRGDKRRGALVGLISAVVLSMVITSPLMGLLDVMQRAVDIAANADDVSLSALGVSDDDRDALDTYANDIPGSLLYRFGGEQMFYTVAAAKLGDDRIYVYRVLDNIEENVEGFIIDLSNIAELGR